MPKKTYIDDEKLIQLTNDHVPVHKIAQFFDCSIATVKRRKKELGLKSYSNISQEDLEKAIVEIKKKKSKADFGVRLTKSELKKNNIIVGSNRVLQTLRSVDSDGIEKRKGKTVKRRQYVCPHGNKVFYFNFVFIIKIKVWHIDYNEKLSPWGFHVHGAVDGYSRLILWERLTLNKSPITGNIFII